ncbi:MAG: hypothetical protein ACFCBW_20995 [Candidatus Competibacterales bacterium]
MTTNDHPPWLKAVKATLDEGADSLPPATRQALARARRRALAQGPEVKARARPELPTTAWLWPAGSLAASVFALGLWLVTQEKGSSLDEALVEPAPTLIEDLELWSTTDPEFYRSLEFYQWLEQRDAGS